MMKRSIVGRDKIVLANWKAHLAPDKTLQWLHDFSRSYNPLPAIQVILAVPSLNLERLRKECGPLKKVSLACQDISSFPQGGYTGALPASWLSGQVEYALVGHRERRRYFRETIQDVAAKVRESVAAGITPVVCCDRELFSRQLAALDTADIDHMICAYTPDDAESLEVALSAETVAEVAAFFASKTGESPVLYGGGVNKKNIGELISLPAISGVMAASSSLDPADFMSLLTAASDALYSN